MARVGALVATGHPLQALRRTLAGGTTAGPVTARGFDHVGRIATTRFRNALRALKSGLMFAEHRVFCATVGALVNDIECLCVCVNFVKKTLTCHVGRS